VLRGSIDVIGFASQRMSQVAIFSNCMKYLMGHNLPERTEQHRSAVSAILMQFINL